LRRQHRPPYAERRPGRWPVRRSVLRVRQFCDGDARSMADANVDFIAHPDAITVSDTDNRSHLNADGDTTSYPNADATSGVDAGTKPLPRSRSNSASRSSVWKHRW